MALPRTDTVELQDWVVVASFDDIDTADVFHIPCPFPGYIERASWCGDLSPDANMDITININGGATLATIVVPSSQAALTPLVTEYGSVGSPVQFAERDVIVLTSDALVFGSSRFFTTSCNSLAKSSLHAPPAMLSKLKCS